MLKSVVQKNRSCRRFYENKKVGLRTLKSLVELARLSASSANLQPLKYFLSFIPETNQKIFPCLKWAGYLRDWQGPARGERPSAYIVVLGDTRISRNFAHDAGIAVQSILLGAVEKGLRGCIIGSIDRKRLKKALKLNRHLDIVLVISLGKSREKTVIEIVGKDGSIEYWRDKKEIHHVPKRPLKDIIVNWGEHRLSGF